MIMSYPIRFTFIKEKGKNSLFEIELIDFKQKKIIEAKSVADLNDQTKKFLLDEGQKLEDEGNLPTPSNLGTEISENGFVSNILYKMDFDDD